MELNAPYQCGFCGEQNWTFVDASGGPEQTYVEDCQVCCRPNVLRVQVDPEGQGASIQAEWEG